MKKLLLFLFIFSQSIYAQVENFSVSDKKMVWENVYISNETNFPQLLERHSGFRILSQTKNIFKGTANSIKCSCPEVSSVLDNAFNFNFEIELRGDKYRVTLTDFVFTDKGKSIKGNRIFIENSILRSDEAARNDLACLNNYFNRVFSMTVYYKNKS